MADPLVADVQQYWREYRDGVGSHSPGRFAWLFTESVDGGAIELDELRSLVDGFPGSEELAARVHRSAVRRSAGVAVAEEPELLRLAEAHLTGMADYAQRVEDSAVADLLAGVERVVVVPADEFDANVYREDPAELFTDVHWDAVNQRLVELEEPVGLLGLREACWGVAADRFVVLHLLDPVIGDEFGFEHFFELWLRGSATAYSGDTLNVRGL